MKDNKYTVMVARFPMHHIDLPPLTDWLMQLNTDLLQDDRIGAMFHKWYDGTPITMMRNRVCREALELGADILLMLDNDNVPHADFWVRALELIDRRYKDIPTVVAAPYCGPPPDENVYIFRWESLTSGDPEGATNYRLRQYSREEAAIKSDFEPAAALPTGCIAIDMRIFSGWRDVRPLPKPWFYYEWEDDYQSAKKSTEDVTFTRNVAALYSAATEQDICFVDWSCWAIHRKVKNVGQPGKSAPQNIMRMFERYVKEGEGADAGLSS